MSETDRDTAILLITVVPVFRLAVGWHPQVFLLPELHKNVEFFSGI